MATHQLSETFLRGVSNTLHSVPWTLVWRYHNGSLEQVSVLHTLPFDTHRQKVITPLLVPAQGVSGMN